jgi:peptidylprolyl isomerase
MSTSIRPVVAIAFAIAALWQPRPAAAQATDAAAPPDLTAPPADATKSATGLISKMLRPGKSSEKPAATDIVTVEYAGWSSDGKMFDSTAARGNPSTFTLSRVMAGWRECVQLMAIGEKRRCWVPQNLAYKGQAGRPAGTVVFDIELVEMRPSPTIPPPDVAGPPEDAKRTASGLAYKVLRPGFGVRRPDGLREVTVHYTGWTTDGKMFDSSVPRGAPTTMRLDEVIKGWSEGVQLMVEGERMRFWIPQDLAYKGQAGSPRGMLVFDIELVHIE